MARRWIYGVLAPLALILPGCVLRSPIHAPAPSPVPAVGAKRAEPRPRASRRDRVLEALARDEVEIARAMRDADVAGLSMGVVVDGELVWTRGIGVADITRTGPPDADTLFRIGSVTKTFTGLALLQLRDEGRVKLDDPVERYIPELSRVQYPTTDSAPITIRQLLTHSSGLSRMGNRAPLAPHGYDGASEGVLWPLDGLTLVRPPGLGNVDTYSNLGAALAGMVVANAAGESYQSFVSRRLLQPLGMVRTVWSAHGLANVATGHLRGGPKWVASPALDLQGFAAAGGLYSSVADLARYVAFEMGAWPPRDGPDPGPVRRSSVRESHLVAGFQHPSLVSWGAFWELRTDCGGVDIVEHNGAVPDGFTAKLAMIPAVGVAVVAVANSYDSRGTRPLQNVVASILTTAMPAAAPPFPTHIEATVRAMVALGLQWNEAKAEALFDRNFQEHVPLSELRPFLSRMVGSGNCTARPVAYSPPDEWSIRLDCGNALNDVHLKVELAPEEKNVEFDQTKTAVITYLTARPAAPCRL